MFLHEILVANEVVHEVKTKKRAYLIVKFEFEK